MKQEKGLECIRDGNARPTKAFRRRRASGESPQIGLEELVPVQEPNGDALISEMVEEEGQNARVNFRICEHR